MPTIAETSDFTKQEASYVVLISERQEVLATCAQRMTLAGFQITTIGYSGGAVEMLRRDTPPLTVIDLSLPNTTGLEVLEAIQREKLETAIIAVSRDGSLEYAVKAMKLGAFDYLPEPFDNDRLILVMHKALGHPAPIVPLAGNSTVAAIEELQGFIGLSPAMRDVYSAIENAGSAADNVLITGESGTGRDVCARAIHACSSRRHQPFVTINCAAIPKALIESEMFGHVKGAFPGAVTDRTALVTEAHGGTLFLDEICELDPQVQAKIPRLVKHGTFQRLGKSELEQVDLRIICATSQNPQQALEEGRLQENLFNSLNATLIDLPPLRQHSNDIMQIAKHLLFGKPPSESTALDAFMPRVTAQNPAQGWRGDIRGLQSALQNAIAMDNDKLPKLAQQEPDEKQPPKEEIKAAPPPETIAEKAVKAS